MTSRKICLILGFVVFVGFVPVQLAAEITDFGGFTERIKGGGDKEPPRCRIDAPLAAQAPFSVKWFCQDDIPDLTPTEKIRTSFWMKRHNDPRKIRLASFLGFPASVLIDEAILQVSSSEDFTSGLPITVQIEASDTAGNTTFSPALTISSRASVLGNCDLTIVTAASESQGGLTGMPSLTVDVNDAVINSTESSGVLRTLSVRTAADTCEIETVCADDDHVIFDAVLTLGDGDSLSGAITISPGIPSVDVSGTRTEVNSVITAFVVTGSTTISGTAAEVTLTCSETTAS